MAGLQPVKANPDVMQPILASINPTVSPCSLRYSRGSIGSDYVGWFIQSMYVVNRDTCETSVPRKVKYGDTITAEIKLVNKKWQIIASNGKGQVVHQHDLGTDPQHLALFQIETAHGASLKESIEFRNIVLKINKLYSPDGKQEELCRNQIPKSCSTPKISTDGLTCEIASCEVQ